jgi:hypothetical protein
LEKYAAEWHHRMDVLDRERERLREERDERIREGYEGGLSTQALASIFGVSQQHVSRIVRR